MKKAKVLFVLMAMIAVMSCGGVEDETSLTTGEKSNLTVKVEGIRLSDVPFERGATAAEATSVNRLVVAVFDATGTKIAEKTQKSGEEGYGTLNFTLTSGTYTVEAVAYKESEGMTVATFSSNILMEMPWASTPRKTFDTFQGKESVEITSQTEPTVSVSMNRAIAAFTIVSNDKIPEVVTGMTITFSNGSGYKLNPSTGLAAVDEEHTIELATSSQMSESTPTFTVHTYLPADEKTMTITVKALDKDQTVLYSHVLTGTMKRNRMLKATGNFFESGATVGFTFNTEWLEDENITY